MSGSLDPDRYSSPATFCRYAVKYIADPSTVRARCLENFTSAPSRWQIGEWRKDHEAKARRFRQQADSRGMQA